jgi:tRNA (guanine37-N1)-methyltransferase
MHIDIISVVPELLSGPLQHSILSRATEKGIFTYAIHSLRDFGTGNYKSVDDYPYGGGGGMVMQCEPLSNCIESLMKSRQYDQVIYLTPDGIPLKQTLVNRLSLYTNILLICGHYKGIDQRIREKYVTMEISIGDYVLSGGELAAAVLTDAIVRVIPGVLGDESSALSDSFMDGLLAPPIYSRPETWNGMKVPEVLLSGNPEKIQEWRMNQAIERTQTLRPDLLKNDTE